MSVRTVLWRLASPYDAYVAHVSRLQAAIGEIRYLVQRALGYEATLLGSVRLLPAVQDAAARAARFREQLSSAAGALTDDQFEEFIAHLGGGSTGAVESDRARTVERLTAVTASLERYFAGAAAELAVLEQRDYRPGRAGVSRALASNGLEPHTLADFRHILRDLGAQVGRGPG